MNTENFKNLTKELLESAPDGVNMVALGYKKTNGIQTDELSVVYGVDKKKPLSELSNSEIIPSSINSNNQQLPTDVQQLPSAKFCGGSCFLSNEASSADHRIKHRPLIGGITLPYINLEGYMGTLGGIFVDKDDNSLVALTNCHVAVKGLLRGLFNTQKPNNYIPFNTFGRFVPQTDETDLIIDPEDIIGYVKRYYPFDINNIGNLIDAAVISIDNVNDIGVPNSYRVLGLNNIQPLPIATSQEIDNLLVNNTKLIKSGRTTGLNSSLPDQNPQLCSIIVDFMHASHTVSDNNTIAVFNDLIIFRYSQTRATNFNGNIVIVPRENVLVPGDSGSLLIGYINNTYKIVGLCFAENTVLPNGNPLVAHNLGYACRIDHVMNLLNLEKWDGSSLNTNPRSNWKYITRPQLIDDVTIIDNNEKYWTIGSRQPNESIFVNYGPAIQTSPPPPSPSTPPPQPPEPSLPPLPPQPPTVNCSNSEFYVLYPPISESQNQGPSVCNLYFTGSQGTVINIESSIGTITVTIGSNNYAIYAIPVSLKMSDGLIENKGIYIQSSLPITCEYFYSSPANSNGAHVFPKEMLSKFHYSIPFLSPTPNPCQSSGLTSVTAVNVIATEDNTIVEFKDLVTNTITTKNLNRLQVTSFLISNISQVTSNNNIAVYNSSFFYGLCNGASNAQIVPISGAEYLTTPYLINKTIYQNISNNDAPHLGDAIQISAIYPGSTIVRLNGNYLTTLSQFQTYTYFNLTENTVIEGDKGLMVFRYKKGARQDPANRMVHIGDPSVNMMMAHTYMNDNYLLAVPSLPNINNFTEFDHPEYYALICIPLSIKNSLKLNGIPVDTSNFTTIVDWSFGTIRLNHTLLSNENNPRNVNLAAMFNFSADGQFSVFLDAYNYYDSYLFTAVQCQDGTIIDPPQPSPSSSPKPPVIPGTGICGGKCFATAITRPSNKSPEGKNLQQNSIYTYGPPGTIVNITGANGWSITDSIPVSGWKEFIIPESFIINSLSETEKGGLYRLGLKILSDNNISCLLFDKNDYASEISTINSLRFAGKNFFIPQIPSQSNAKTTYYYVITLDDNTLLTVSKSQSDPNPTYYTVPKAFDVQKIALAEGHILNVEQYKAAVVYLSNACVGLSTPCNKCTDQIFDTHSFSDTVFVVAPTHFSEFKGRENGDPEGDIVIVVPEYDSTDIYVNGLKANSTPLAAGQSFELQDIKDPIIITTGDNSLKRLQVYQWKKSGKNGSTISELNNINAGVGDPSFATIPGINYWNNSYSILAPKIPYPGDTFLEIEKYYVNIIIPQFSFLNINGVPFDYTLYIKGSIGAFFYVSFEITADEIINFSSDNNFLIVTDAYRTWDSYLVSSYCRGPDDGIIDAEENYCGIIPPPPTPPPPPSQPPTPSQCCSSTNTTIDLLCDCECVEKIKPAEQDISWTVVQNNTKSLLYDNYKVRVDFFDSLNCSSSSTATSAVQTAILEGVLTTTSNIALSVSFIGNVERQDADFDRMEVIINGSPVLIANGYSDGLGCQMSNTPNVNIQKPVVLLGAGIHNISINCSTIDGLFHIDSFYEVRFQYQQLNDLPCTCCTDLELMNLVCNGVDQCTVDVSGCKVDILQYSCDCDQISIRAICADICERNVIKTISTSYGLATGSWNNIPLNNPVQGTYTFNPYPACPCASVAPVTPRPSSTPPPSPSSGP